MFIYSKDLISNRIEINELQTKLGLDDDGEADQNRKILQLVKLNQQKDDIERKLTQISETLTRNKIVTNGNSELLPEKARCFKIRQLF